MNTTPWASPTASANRRNLLLLVLLCCMGCSTAAYYTYLKPLATGPIIATRHSLDYQAELFTLRLTALKGDEKKAAGRELGFPVDRFVTHYLALRLVFTNTSQTPMSINYDTIYFQFPDASPSYSLDFFSLLTAANKAGNSTAERYIQQNLKQGRQTIPSQRCQTSLLVFPRIDTHSQNAFLVFANIYVNGESKALRLPFTIDRSKDIAQAETMGF